MFEFLAIVFKAISIFQLSSFCISSHSSTAMDYLPLSPKFIFLTLFICLCCSLSLKCLQCKSCKVAKFYLVFKVQFLCMLLPLWRISVHVRELVFHFPMLKHFIFISIRNFITFHCACVHAVHLYWRLRTFWCKVYHIVIILILFFSDCHHALCSIDSC